eukprot:614875-Amphidinium_carterae.1
MVSKSYIERDGWLEWETRLTSSSSVQRPLDTVILYTTNLPRRAISKPSTVRVYVFNASWVQSSASQGYKRLPNPRNNE